MTSDDKQDARVSADIWVDAETHVSAGDAGKTNVWIHIGLWGATLFIDDEGALDSLEKAIADARSRIRGEKSETE